MQSEEQSGSMGSEIVIRVRDGSIAHARGRRVRTGVNDSKKLGQSRDWSIEVISIEGF